MPQNSGQQARQHVAVIGAGIIGVATAIWLQRLGHKVTLIDREGPAAGASFGNGGVLAACAVVPVTVPGLFAKAPGMLLDPRQPLFLRRRYLPRLIPWILRYLRHANAADATRIAEALSGLLGTSLADHQALAEGTGAESYVVPSDYVYLYASRKDYEADAFGWGLRRRFGFDWEEMTGDEARRFDPLIGPEIGFAARMGDHGRISDPERYVTKLAKHLIAEGGRMVQAEVTDLERDTGAITGVRLRAKDGQADTLACDAAVIATGAWSGPLAAKLGLRVPLESERGYHIDLWEPSQQLRAPVMVAAGKFVATPMEGRIRLAGIVEYGGLDAPESKTPPELLRHHVRRAFPELQWREESVWMGHRPVTADSLPLIGAVPGLAGAYAAFGHQHIGLTAGARTGQLLAQMISGQHVNLPMAAFDPARFQR